ncbi:putative alpha/beta hydrolase [Aspergillus caelatus]|uniref:Putative alpha/beta hydrolase n=1 Tax=Aspergillus caelatus TaxID=61420 RepID=A0A5N7A9P0_9EURO|nr:putative alpha/beta hydrolase [Aspergillus caelatus]KAE8366435.1 putative alpha/beta hydrolase [Aspergillus caelatus]
MIGLNQLLAVKPAPLLGALTAAIFFAFYGHPRYFLQGIQHLPEEHTITRAKAQLPYPADAFPGGRRVQTVYGTIQVFEWGPEHGEKVLLVHGLGTPCIALGNMAKEFVRRGYRVMMFDLFGRGYSETPNDLPHDARLYTTQVLLVLSSSPLAWTGSSAFHIIGFSLGGSIAVAFAAYHATMLRSITLICPGGLIRTSHISRRSQVLYSSSFIPEWLRLRLLRRDLEPSNGAPSADVPDGTQDADVDFDAVPIAADRPQVRIGDVIRWQLRANPGFVPSYLSTILGSLVYRRYDRIWKVLRDELARRRTADAPPGLPCGHEFLEDMEGLLCREDVDLHVMKGGHEIGVLRGKDVASIAVESWK